MFKSLMPRNNALGIVEFCDEKFFTNVKKYIIMYKKLISIKEFFNQKIFSKKLLSKTFQ